MSYRNKEEYVKLPSDKLREIVSAVYDISRPVGMGMIHFTPGPIDDEALDSILSRSERGGSVYMDYVRGRQCKFSAYLIDGDWYVRPEWLDHTHEQLVDLLTRVGVEDAEGQIEKAKQATA